MRESKSQNLMKWRRRLVSLEIENLLTKVDGEPISQKDIQRLWREFLKHDWSAKPDYYTKVYTEVSKTKPNGKTYNLGNDTGVGIFEMSLPPCRNLHEARKEFLEILKETLKYIKKQKMRFLAYGIQPTGVKDPRAHKSKKSFYATIEFLNLHNLIVGTAASQCGISLRLEEVVDVTNQLNKISGLITALFANSPITDKKIYHWKEMRMLPWDFLGITIKPSFENIYGFPKREFRSIADILKYAWESPPFGIISFLRETGWAILDKEINYTRYFKGKEWKARDLFSKRLKLVPNVKDLNLALIAFWIHAKPHLVLDVKKVKVADFMGHLQNNTLEKYLKDKLVNCYIEYRVAAASPKGEEVAFAALTLGLVNNLKELKKLTTPYSWGDWKKLYEEAPVKGMEARLKGREIYPILEKLVKVAEKGLKRRKFDEEKYLKPLKKRLRDKKCPADYAVEKFQKYGFRKFLDFVSY